MISPIQSDVCPATAVSVDATSQPETASADAPFAALLADAMQPAKASFTKSVAPVNSQTSSKKVSDSDGAEEPLQDQPAEKDEPSAECCSILASMAAVQTVTPPAPPNIAVDTSHSAAGTATDVPQNVDVAAKINSAGDFGSITETGSEQASTVPLMTVPLGDIDQPNVPSSTHQVSNDAVQPRSNPAEAPSNAEGTTNSNDGKERGQKVSEHHRGLPLQPTPPTLPTTGSTNKVAKEFDPAGARSLPTTATDSVPVQQAATSPASPETATQTPLQPEMSAATQGIAQAVQAAKPITSKSANGPANADVTPVKTHTLQPAEQTSEKNTDATAQHDLSVRPEMPAATTSSTQHAIATAAPLGKSLENSSNSSHLESRSNGPNSALTSPVAKEALPDDAARSHDVIQSARILDRLGHSEMQVGINTEMGRVDIHTVVRDTHVAASFAVERSELGAMLTADMPSLESALTRNHLDLSGASVGSYQSGTTSSDSGQQQRQTSAHTPWTQASTPVMEHEQESTLNMIALSSPRYSSGGLNVHA